MKIIIIDSKDSNIYQNRISMNLLALLEGKHDVEYICGERKIAKRLKDKQPDIILAFTNEDDYKEIVCLPFYKKPLFVSSRLKEADIYLNGEPEAIFPLLIDSIEQGKDFSRVPGITYKVTTAKPEKWDISTLPLCNKNYHLALSTRGCKGQCSFCSQRITQGSLRFRDLSQTMQEIKNFVNANNRHICFADCSFDSNPPDRMKELLKMIIKEVPGITFEANFRPDFCKMVDNELWDLLVTAGLVRAFIGVESFNQKDLDLYNKQCTLEDIENTLRAFQEHDVEIDIGFININPFSTYEGLWQNLNFLKKYGFATPATLFHPLTTHDGDTPIKQKIRDLGLFINTDEHNYQVPGVGFLIAFWRLYKNLSIHKNAFDIFQSLRITEVKRVKRLFRLYGLPLEKVEYYEKQLQEILKERSDRMVEWFTILLKVLPRCHEYSREDLTAMSNNYLSNEYMKETNRKFNCLLKEFRQEINAACK